MSISFNAAADLGNNGGSGTLSVSYTSGSGANRMLALAIKGDTGTDNITGVTYNSVTCSLAAKLTPAGGMGDRWIYLYYLLNPSSGSNTLSITTSGGYILAGAADYTGVKQSGQPDATSTSSVGVALTLTGTITTVADQCWTIMAWGGYASNFAPTAGAGSTRRTYDAAFGTYGLFDSGGPITPAGSYSMTAQYPGQSSNGINLAMASFAPATSPPPGGGLFRPANLVTGAGGPFFANPLNLRQQPDLDFARESRQQRRRRMTWLRTQRSKQWRSTPLIGCSA